MADNRRADNSNPTTNRPENQPTRKRNVSSESDWEETVRRLLDLAKEASGDFDYEQTLKHLDTAEEILESKALAKFSNELRTQLHKEKGKVYSKQGRLKESIEQHQKVLEYCRDSSQLQVRSETFIQIGQLLGRQGDHDRALGYIQRAIGAYRRLGDDLGTCRALRNLGVVYVDLGEFEEAEINFDEAIEIAQAIGDKLLYADLVNNLGTINGMKGNRERALHLYDQSLKIYLDLEEKRKAAYTQNNIGITFIEREMHEEAFDYFRSAYKTAESIKDASLGLIVDINLADLYLHREEYRQAQRHCQFARAYLDENKMVNVHLVETMKIFGKIAAGEERHEEALEHFNEAVENSRQLRAQFVEAEVLLERGILATKMDKPFDALNDLEQSYDLYRTVKAEGRQEQTEKVIGSIEELYLDIFHSMAQKVDRKDTYTKGHSDRVAALSLLLGKELGLGSLELKTLVAGGLLHDLGKVKIDDSILKKDGRLTDDEFFAIKKHPELGLEVLEDREFPWDVYPIVLHHHERYDGRGYPTGVAGEDIPMLARIVCVADVFDALTSDRVYRKAFPTEKALDIMKGDAGTAFDAHILKAFVTLIESGRADLVINSKTREDELFSIWSQCMSEDTDAA